MRFAGPRIVLLLVVSLGVGLALEGREAARFVLVNEIRYSGASFTDLPGNGFLVDAGDEVLAVTCKHVLWENRSQGMTTVSLGKDLVEWRMVVRDDPSQYVVLGELLNASTAEPISERNTDRDFLVFAIRENHSRVTPLKLSPKAPPAGEKLRKVGWSFQHKQGAALWREALAVLRQGPSLLIENLSRQNEAGSSGSPVLNARGELVGIVSSWKYDPARERWLEALCSTDPLWEILYCHWLKRNGGRKSLDSWLAFLDRYESLNRSRPEVSSFLITELFFSDWLRAKGREFGTPDAFAQWAVSVRKSHGLCLTADACRQSQLVFGSWAEGFLAGNKSLQELEGTLRSMRLFLPPFIDFCELAERLIHQGQTDRAISVLLFAAEKMQHQGQVYAYLGDAYRVRNEGRQAREAYEKCLKTYPGYPMAVAGLALLGLEHHAEMGGTRPSTEEK